MADNNQYEISLGVKLDTDNLGQQISTAESKLDPIKIQIDAETKELAKQIESALKTLTNGSKNVLTLDTTKVETSLNEIAQTIKDIKSSFNTLGSKSGMKSLLSTIDQIGKSLDKASDKFDKLNAELSALSKKDFGFNLNIKAGNSSPVKAMTDYGRAVTKDAVPAMQKQIRYLKDLFGTAKDADTALERYLFKLHKGYDGLTVKRTLEREMTGYDLENKKISKADRMFAHEEYVRLLKEAAEFEGINLDGFNAEFSKTADEIVNDTIKIQTGAKQAEEELENVTNKLKQVFGGGIGAEQLSAELKPIIDDLRLISEAVTKLSKNTSFSGLTKSFDRLSESLEKLMANATATQKVLGEGFNGSITSSSSGTVDNSVVQSAQQTGREIGNAIELSIEQSLDVDDIVDEQVRKLMDAYGIKGSKAFDEIRQAVVAYRNELMTTDNADDNAFDNTSGIRQVTSALANNMKVADETKETYAELVQYIKEFNNSGRKVSLMGSIKEEYGDDFRSMRSSLGKGFTTKGGGLGFDVFIDELNSVFGNVIDTSKGYEYAFEDLVNKLRLGRDNKKISGDDIFKNGYSIHDMEDEITSTLSAIDRTISDKQIAKLKEIGFDTANFDKAESELNDVKNRIEEVTQAAEKNRQALENVYSEAAEGIQNAGVDSTPENFENLKGSLTERYESNIAILEEEKAELQSKLPVLEETYNRERQLLTESYQQIRENTEQRKLEAQQAQETANTAVQSAEKEQKAAKETAQELSELQKYYKKYQPDASDWVVGEKIKVDKDRIIKQLTEPYNEAKGITQKIGVFTDPSGISQKDLDYFSAMNAELKKLGYTLGEIKWNANSYTAVADIIPIDENAITNAEEMKRVLFDLEVQEEKVAQTSTQTANTVEKNAEKQEQAYKEVSDAAERATQQSKNPIINVDEFTKGSIDGAVNRIENLRESLEKLGFSDDAIESIIQDFKNLNVEVKSLTTTLNGNTLSINATGIDRATKNKVSVSGTFSPNDDPEIDSKINVDRFTTSVTQRFNETEESFERLKFLAKEISNLRIDIFKSDDTADISKAIAKLEELNNEFDELFAKTKGNLSNRQISQLNNLVDQGDAKVLKEFNNELNEFVALQKQIENKRFEIGKLEVIGDKNNEIGTLKKQLEELEKTYDHLMTAFMKKVSANGDFVHLDDFKGLENGIAEATKNAENRLERFKSQYADMRAELAKKIAVGIEVGDFDDSFDRMTANYNKLSGASEKLENSLEETKRAFKVLNEVSKEYKKGAVNADELITAQNRYNESLEKTNNLIKIQTRQENKENAKIKLENDAELFNLKIDSWLAENSAAINKFGKQMLDLKVDVKSVDQIKLNQLKQEFQKIDKEADKAGLKMQTLGDRIKTKFKEYSAYFSVAEVFMYVTQGLRDMFDQVVAIDTAMTELKKVTDESDATYSQFLSNAASRAKELGVTIDGLVTSAADFARLGYDFKDVQGLAEVANIYAVVGDEIDSVDTATQSLVSTLTAFKEEANGLSDSDFAMSIVDKFNEVSNNFAISSGGIGEALQRSASSMAAANNTLDETIALITAANTVVQDPDSVGTAFKTISMRIRGAKTELEEAGLETEGMATSVSTLRSEIKALSGVDIMLNANEFKSTYQIMEELAAKWQDLTDIQQATITELIAGKRQGNIVSSLMNNFDIAQNALETSLNSTGSAMQEHEKWQKSLEAQILKLKSAWQSLSQTFLSSDFLKAALDIVIDFVNVIEKLISTIGTLPTLGIGVGIWGMFDQLSTVTKKSGGLKSLTNIANILPTLTKAFPNAAAGIKVFTDSLKTAQYIQTFSSLLGYTNGGATLAGAATVAKGALSGLWTVMKAHPILTAVATIGLAVTVYDKFTESAEELAERVGEVTSKYKEQHDSLIKLKGDYDTSNADSMISKYGELSKGVNGLGENLSLTTDEYAEYQSIVNTIAEQIPSLVTGYNSQGDAILDCAGDVDKLAESYKNLIKEQNEEVLSTGNDIFKDFKNDLKDSPAYYKTSTTDKFGNIVYKDNYNTDYLSKINELMNMSDEELETAISKLSSHEVEQISKTLEQYGNERNVLGSGDKGWETQRQHIVRALGKDKAEISKILKEASADLNAYAEDMGTVTEAYFSTAFLGGNDSDIGDYSHMSEKMQNIINQITSSFGSEFYNTFSNKENPYEALAEYFDSMLSAFDSLNSADAAKFEAAFDLKTQFNGGKISYGEYINGIQDATRLIDGLGLKEEVESQLKLSLGLSEKDGKWVIEEYETLLNRLTSEKHEIQLDTKTAESFLRGLSSEELKVAINFVEEGNEDFNATLQNYKDIFKEAEEVGVDFSKTVYGNIDTNARQTLEWTSENLAKYKDELLSWEDKDADWGKVKKGLEGSISTVMGAWDTFEIGKDKQKVNIAFSPMLQTDDGAKLLSQNTVNTYINELIKKATSDGSGWNNEELFKLDAEGLEVDGQKISGILADIGKNAEKTAEQMHFVGKDGALALAESEMLAIVEEQARINEALNFEANIEVDATALEAFNEILTESASAMGLTSDSIKSLEAKYSDLDGYDAAKLFERTANGVKVNREELTKLEKKYNDLNKAEVQEHIDTLTQAYNDNVIAIDKCSNAAERAQLISDNEIYKNQIEELATYQAQLEGVTGAYQRWLNAQETPEDYQGYEAVATGREDVQSEIDRGFIGNATKEYIDLLSGKDLQGGTIDDYADAWEKLDDKVTSTGYSVHDFFTLNEDGDITSKGIDRFFKSLRADFEGSVAKYNKDSGEWTYDFSQKNLEAIQKEWGIGIEAIELLLEAAASAGYNIDWDGILDGIDLDTSNFETLVSTAESAQIAFNKLEGVEDVNFNFTCTGVEEATSELEKARSTYIDLITNDDGTINLNANGAEQMRVILATLLIQKQQLEDSNIAINIDTSGLDESQQDIANAINAVKTFREKYKNLEIAVTTGQGIEEAKTELNTAMTELQGLGDAGVDIAAELILGEGATAESLNSKVDAAISAVGSKDIKVGCKLDETAIGTLNSQVLANFTPEATVKITGIDDTLVGQYTSTEKTAEGTVKWKNDDKLVVSYSKIKKTATGTVNWGNNTKDVKTSFSATGTVSWTSGNNVKVNVVSEANGTANANGTAQSGKAFAKGNWGINGSGTALVGELGMETLVRDGRFYTIGDNGAEFIKYQQGDIIFNHRQTEELFKNGKVTFGGGRGRMFANGSAFADGSYPSTGRAFAWSATGSGSNFADNRKNTKAYSSSYTGKKSSSSSSDDFEETLDWIETKISRIERAIDQLDTKANSVYRSWSERNKSLASEISKVGDEISLQQAAYNRYMQEANSVGLSESWAKLVRDGAIDIDTITDENLAEKIKSYTEWYEKALDCKDAILELQEAESKLYAQRFENVSAQYDGILQGFEHTENMLNEYISQAEEQGHIVSKKYYEALIDNEKSNIAQLKKEQADLIASRDEAVDSGAIVKGSEEWYNMCAEIDGVTQAIEESTTALLEYDNAMREIDWSVFDLIQERISDVTDEAEFLIDLMSNDKLFDDNGRLTSQGLATMGLHAQNYNTHMYQADEYGAEVAKLDKQIASDPYDQELINRRNEILELQRESILAAEDEKEAIKDLVSEGIDMELSALEERIDLYNEALDSQKD